VAVDRGSEYDIFYTERFGIVFGPGGGAPKKMEMTMLFRHGGSEFS
jgi:hypothetical protein